MERNGSSITREQVVEDAKKWVHCNHGLEAGRSGYSSPRVSSEIADCSMPLTFDQYNYCSMGCLYCFAFFFKNNNPSVKDFSLKAINPDKMIQDMEGKGTSRYSREYYKYFYKNKFLLHWGGLADPFCSFEGTNNIGLKIIKYLARTNYPTLFSFKGNTIFINKEYSRIFEKYSDQKNFAFQISMVTADDAVARDLEVGVPSPTNRFKAMRTLSDMGYWTILRLRPFIIGVTDETLDELLEKSYESGARGVSFEFMALDGRANVHMNTRYAWLSKLTGTEDIEDYYRKLSPSERGGYRRLNRLVKEIYVKKIYKYCTEHDMVFACSDPDFKELNTSGSCCGMPDNYPENRLLENWTRSQLTYHLKEARKSFWSGSEDKQLLRFDTVYSQDAGYLDSIALSRSQVGVIGKCGAVRENITHRLILREKWNNLDSPANPMNYFHGKIYPVGVDDDENYIYKYVPMDYEYKWNKEGIDLTR